MVEGNDSATWAYERSSGGGYVETGLVGQRGASIILNHAIKNEIDS